MRYPVTNTGSKEDLRRFAINARFSTFITNSLMVRVMFFYIAEKYQVFRSIIISFNIQVMNFFRRSQVSTKNFFHNKAMFHNPAVTIFKGVVGRTDFNITINSFISTTFPCRIVLQRKNTISFISNGSTFKRTGLSNPRRSNFKLRLTNGTNFYHYSYCTINI